MRCLPLRPGYRRHGNAGIPDLSALPRPIGYSGFLSVREEDPGTGPGPRLPVRSAGPRPEVLPRDSRQGGGRLLPVPRRAGFPPGAVRAPNAGARHMPGLSPGARVEFGVLPLSRGHPEGCAAPLAPAGNLDSHSRQNRGLRAEHRPPGGLHSLPFPERLRRMPSGGKAGGSHGVLPPPGARPAGLDQPGSLHGLPPAELLHPLPREYPAPEPHGPLGRIEIKPLPLLP